MGGARVYSDTVSHRNGCAAASRSTAGLSPCHGAFQQNNTALSHTVPSPRLISVTFIARAAGPAGQSPAPDLRSAFSMEELNILNHSPLLPLLLLVCRPGAAVGLSPASLQYSVMQPSASPALGAPLAVTVGRKGSDTPMFDTTGHRWVHFDKFERVLYRSLSVGTP